jgi:hypothetical protein
MREDIHKMWAREDTRRVIEEQPHACFCIGPQNGEPLCPCRMRHRERERQEMRKEILKEFGSKKK